MVVPDNVLFDQTGKEIRKNLMKTCDLHTILRLPDGTFNPYSSGVRANVIFFRKGLPTKDTWVYDLRINIENINKGNPLRDELFKNFEEEYILKPRRESKRSKIFSRQEIENRDYNLDISWVRDEKDEIDLPDPDILVDEITGKLESALQSMNSIKLELASSSIDKKDI